MIDTISRNSSCVFCHSALAYGICLRPTCKNRIKEREDNRLFLKLSLEAEEHKHRNCRVCDAEFYYMPARLQKRAPKPPIFKYSARATFCSYACEKASNGPKPNHRFNTLGSMDADVRRHRTRILSEE